MSPARRIRPCTCLLCVPVEGRRADPVFGYDLDLVPSICCLRCDEPIGDEPYVEEAGVARFGDMFFLHQRCAIGDWKPRLVKRQKAALKGEFVSEKA
jgi:hypothetical protein